MREKKILWYNFSKTIIHLWIYFYLFEIYFSTIFLWVPSQKGLKEENGEMEVRGRKLMDERERWREIPIFRMTAHTHVLINWLRFNIFYLHWIEACTIFSIESPVTTITKGVVFTLTTSAHPNWSTCLDCNNL